MQTMIAPSLKKMAITTESKHVITAPTPQGINSMDYETDEYSADAEGLNTSELSGPEFLMELAALDNIATEMGDVQGDISLGNIAEQVVAEYEVDKKSREEWEETNKKALKAALLIAEEKNYPFKNASNIKYPLLTVAALQFNARAYPAVIQGNRVAKCVTWGDDGDGEKAKRADRVSEHLSYQLLSEMPEWEEDTDRLLVMLPILGSMFRKVYFDPSLGRKCTRLLPPQNLVVNYFARSLEDTPRATEEMPLYPHEIQERINSGRFIDFEYGTDTGLDDETGQNKNPDDSQEPHMFLEQQCHFQENMVCLHLQIQMYKHHLCMHHLYKDYCHRNYHNFQMN